MTVSVSYLSKNCTTCLFISKSFKELFFMASFSKADAKVRLIFELPKLFRSFFQKVFFEAVRFKTSSLFSISTHLRFSLESGCKSTALQHILQTSETLFCKYFAVVHVNRWFSKDAVQQILKAFGLGRWSVLPYYLYARTIYTGNFQKQPAFHTLGRQVADPQLITVYDIRDISYTSYTIKKDDRLF